MVTASLNGRATKQAGLPGLEGFGAALGALTATVDRACDTIDRVLVQPFSDAVDRLNARVEAAKDKVQKLLERASGLASDAQATVLGMGDALAASVATACEEAGCEALPAIEMDEAAWAGMVGENAKAQPQDVPTWVPREAAIAAFAEVERLAEQARTAALTVEAEQEARDAMNAVRTDDGGWPMVGAARLSPPAAPIEVDDEVWRAMTGQNGEWSRPAEMAKADTDWTGDFVARQQARDEGNAARTDGGGWPMAEAEAQQADPKDIAEDACRRFGVNHVAAGAVPDAEAREASAAPKPPRKSRKGGK